MHSLQTKTTVRPLTMGEIAMAKTVFKNSINYKKVRIYHERYICFHLTEYVMAPDGNIYYPPGNSGYSSDISTSNIDNKAIFMHEMVHVWQYQQGEWLIFKKIYSHTYEYELESDKSFEEYGMEQQAEIVKDYYLLLNNFYIPNRKKPIL